MKTIRKRSLLPLLLGLLTFDLAFSQESDEEEDGIACGAIAATVGVVSNVILTDQAIDTTSGRIAAGLASVFIGWATHEICEDIDSAAEEAFEDVAYAWGITIVPVDSSLPGNNGAPWCMHVNENACDPFSNDDTFQNLMDAWSIMAEGMDNLRFGGANSSFAVFTENSFASAFESAALNYEAQSGFMSTTTTFGDGSD